MGYRAAGNRCAVILNSLNLGISDEQALIILSKEGFRSVTVDIVKLAYECISTSKYCRGARLYQAPLVVDCSSFIKWLYAMRGIWLPRRSIQQFNYGQPVSLENLMPGDVLFVSGRINYYDEDPTQGIGHVGIATGLNTIIHAANSKIGVTENTVTEFISKYQFRGAKRYLPIEAKVLTFETPEAREVETSDDIKWIIRQSLPNPKKGGL